jgi:predicted nucleic acid-binding protein
MSIDADTRVFFDASCLIAASGSPSGGSGFLLDLCRRGLLQGVVSPLVLIEAERNIRNKLSPAALAAFQAYLSDPFLQLADIPPESGWESFETVVGQKDAHVLAAGLRGDAPFLLTLDQALADRVNGANLGVRALSPGEFITTVLPEHADYPSLR